MITKTDINKEVELKGEVFSIGKPYIRITNAKFECPSCFPKGTKVLCPNGYKPIEKADEIVCLDKDLNPIIQKTDIVKTGKKQIFTINNEIECSKEHKWFVYRNRNIQVIQTKDLKEGDTLLMTYGRLFNMQKKYSKGISKKGKENLQLEMQEEIGKSSSKRDGKNKIRQQKNNFTIQVRTIYDKYSRFNGNKPQNNQKKINKIWNAFKEFVGTDKNRNTKTEKTLEISEREIKSIIQAWTKLWDKKERQLLSEFGGKRKGINLREMWKQRGFISSPQRFKPLQQSNRELRGFMSFLPYKVTLVNKEKRKREMYDLKIPYYNNFILENGLLTHNCGTIISIIQNEFKLNFPKRCSCGRKSGFRIVETTEAEGQILYLSERGTEFTYKIYIEKIELIRILKKINEGCAITIKGIVKVEYSKGSAIGDLVIYANKIVKKSNHIQGKVVAVGSN